MPWGGHKAYFCHGCGKHRNEVGRLSARYKCVRCSEDNLVENNRQLAAHDGPRFEYWRRRTLAAFGVAVVDTTGDEA